jgi:hypothetical protein
MEENKNQNSSKFDPQAIVEDMKTQGAALKREIQKIQFGVSDIDTKLEQTEYFIDKSLKEFKETIANTRITISDEDVKKLDSYKDFFKHYKPFLYISVFALLSGLGMSFFGVYSGVKWYQESVRTKQEIREEVFQEIESKGSIIVNKELWESYEYQEKVLKSWKKSNPEDHEKLSIYYQGYQASEKGKK